MKVGSGVEQLTGEFGEARSAIGPDGGKAFVHGEWWDAWSDEEIPAKSEIEVLKVENLKIKVRRKGGQE
jgi:membrane-bound serine protease (ClpP class)